VKILLVGHYGRQNLGDDAMLEGISNYLHGKHELIVLSPQNIQGCRTLKESIFRLFKGAFWADWVLFGGGTYIHDEHTNSRFKNRGIIKIVIVVIVAKFFRCKTALVGMGIGPLKEKATKWMTCRLIEGLNYISVRDSASLNELKCCKNTAQIELTFDSCVMLSDLERASLPRKTINNNEFILGLNILPYYKIYHDRPQDDRKIIDSLIKSLREAFEKDQVKQLKIKIFTFNLKSEESEQATIAIARTEIEKFAEIMVIPYSNALTTLKSIETCNAFIGMRYHSSMMAYLGLVPQLVLSYHPKCRWLAEEIGLPSKAIIDVEDLNFDLATSTITELISKPENYLAKLPIKQAKQKFLENYFPEEIRY
jgi:polysaccharide pyruvyl transferase WcaK-like protein